MVEEIEDTIQRVTKENDSANQALSSPEKGCDEYLDRANEQMRRFEDITSHLKVLNENTIIAFNNNQDEAYGLLPAMRTLLEACNRNLVSLGESEFKDAMLSTVERFQDEASQLKENIDDFILIHDRMPHDAELQLLLSQL